MPQVPKDATLEKENKRRRGVMSCAECRRLKLKCDKLVPCSSCTRRGCKDICPTGSLVTGQGTRFVLADTHKLHTKIAQMSERIRTLEDALEVLQSQNSSEPHPLLARELLNIKSSLDLHAAVEDESRSTAIANDEPQPQEESHFIDSFGTLTIREDGSVTTFYGRSAGHESVLLNSGGSHHVSPSRGSQPARGLPLGISAISNAFPFSHSLASISLQDLHTYLPPWPEASKLCDLYLDVGPWFYGVVTKSHLLDEILPMWYPSSPRPDNYVHKEGDAHDLSLLFIVFCFGALTDERFPAPPDNPEADLYYGLTKAALSLDSPMERLPSVSTVQALSMMGIYQGLCNGENNIECMWAYFGLSTKLAQSIGLHKDCARWKLSATEVQKRRALFFELLITDGWQSLSTGRLPTFSLPFVDCELPLDTEQKLDDEGNPVPSFPFWKARFGAECVAAIVQGTLTSRAPKYSIILDLDRKVRDMELPKYASGTHPIGATLAQTMAHFMPKNYRELSLLYIHRCFFAHAISSSPLDPIKSQYAPSFLAGYRSAREMVNSVRLQFSLFPAKIARFWVLWTHAFSATIMLASVVTHAPKAKVASAALIELKNAVSLFEEAAKYGGRAVKLLPVLQRLWEKAQSIYLNTRSGLPAPHDNNILAPPKPESESDEFSIFSGKTHTITKTAQRPLRPSTQSPSPHNSPIAAAPAFVDAHPSLVQELGQFEHQINAQIREAYTSRRDIFTRSSSHDHTRSASIPYSSPLQVSEQGSYPNTPVESTSSHHTAQSGHQPSYPLAVTSGAFPRRGPTYENNHFDTSGQPHYHQQEAPAQQYATFTNQSGQAYHRAKLDESMDQDIQHTEQIHYHTPYAPQTQTQYWTRDHAYNSNYSQNLMEPNQQCQPTHIPPTQASYPAAHLQQSVASSSQQAVHYYQQQQQQYLHSAATQSYYTTDGYMRGLAAEDSGLQQTWTSYMERVSSPRQFGPN